MSKLQKLYERMKNNPQGNWRIEDIKKLVDAYGFEFHPPSGGGSHYKLSHPKLQDIQTVPFNRPVKSYYIKQIIILIEEVESQNER